MNKEGLSKTPNVLVVYYGNESSKEHKDLITYLTNNGFEKFHGCKLR